MVAFGGEVLGTFLIALVATGSTALALLSGSSEGDWLVPMVSGAGVTLAMYIAAPLSGAHLNPAVSLATALWRPDRFPIVRLPWYWLAQLVGAAVAGLVVLATLGAPLATLEARVGLSRGSPGSELTAMPLVEAFPNPATTGGGTGSARSLSRLAALLIEAAGTTVLVFVIFALSARDQTRMSRTLSPVCVGVTVAALTTVIGPLTQAGLNPARDLGPRLVAFFAGYGSVAIPGVQSGFWIYLVGPILGGAVGGFIADRVFDSRRCGRGSSVVRVTTELP